MGQMTNQPTASAGVGYGGDAATDKRARTAGKKKAAQLETKLAGEQQKLLKNSHASLVNDPPDESLLSTIREVLRNQVPNEWSKRRKLYEAALECCRLITEHHPEKLGTPDDDEALMAALEEFAQHAEMIATHEQTSTKADAVLTSKILEIRQKAASKMVRPEMSVMDPHEHYRQALRPLRFELVETLQGHSFASHQQNARMDSRRLFRELATYKTALPIEHGSSIFVRAMENRLDLLRACITGPVDTPYSNGAFIFDIYLGDYPKQPPKVKYLTTGGGRYRFNPNLYQDGKVCLSLLGTWSGPGWVSGESTLLQVLISIQSLILVNDPYFNEPGYQRSMGTPSGTAQSNTYNANIRKFTLEVCILPFLSQAPCPYPEFGEALQRHFRNKRSVLQKQLFRWYQEDTTKILHKLYAQYLDIMDEHSNGKRKAVASSPAREIKTDANGVIQLDSDDEEDAGFSKKRKMTNTSDDSSKPAAVYFASSAVLAVEELHVDALPVASSGVQDVVDLT